MYNFASLILIISLAAGCTEEVVYDLSSEEIMKPEACAECHPVHFDEWSGSMHAYSSKDPIFLAMNKRGQRETNGELGDLCVRCHAPLAVALGETTDGLNLEELPDHLQGVNCYFCHSVDKVEGSHNNPIKLATDNIMRGGVFSPMKTTGHASAYSEFLDGDNLKSSEMCGSCHDIVLPNGTHIERTFAEWQHTIYSKEETQPSLSCTACHFNGVNAPIADVEDAPQRRHHSHMNPGVDLALNEFPFREEQRAAVQSALDSTLSTQVCVYPDGVSTNIVVSLENIAAGHKWPSGASPDRRAWVEVIAKKDGEIIYHSGKVSQEQAVSEVEVQDSTIWVFRDHLQDAQGNDVHMFWEAEDYTSELLPAPTSLSPFDPSYIDTHVTRYYPIQSGEPDEVEVVVHIRPVGLDFVDDLIASGDLEPSIRNEVPTITIEGSRILWKASLQVPCIPAL